MKPLKLLTLATCSVFCLGASAQDSNLLRKQVDSLKSIIQDYEHRFDVLEKKIDDNQWFIRLKDVAFVDKVFIYGPPNANAKDTTKVGATNPVKFYSYVFIPKGIDASKKYPLIVLPHGGVHADFTTYHYHIIRELLAQKYIVVAPEYRGSTGYGKSFWQLIDYGGREVDDVEASRQYMVENYDFVDPSRVGIVGWSHGGMIAMNCLYRFPTKYKVAFAGVPVSDLILRLSYSEPSYAKLFSASYHIGKTIAEDSAEYKRRSPAFNAHLMPNVPLLIHTNTNDDDVHVEEVKTLIAALKKENKKFEYEIFQRFPGGHSFDRIDGKKNREIRLRIWKFIDKSLNAPVKIKTLQDMSKAAYLPAE
ncbi:alpha/beta hydrolase family protein [Alistipes sp. ZOR0009]|uniref:alpha/beta hydrolase family protein n=1 Tax=Alistipes sp. ZOR0009 TaxID=1339253 RepID=UPI000647F78B|nr:alpha/beta fold hydrolase [Alistipes sp. ZOR0009]